MSDRYELTEKLGKDEIGSIYLAEDTKLKRRVLSRHISFGENSGLQQHSESWKQELADYAGKLGVLQHPNTLAIYDISVNDQGVNVVSEFVDGESVSDRLKNGAFSQGGVYEMASDMLDVLYAAHSVAIYHGSLNTGSIRRVHRAVGGNRYILVDLGLGHLASIVKGESVPAKDPILLAPELHDKSRAPDMKSDLFMLGQICYTALAGEHPYWGKSPEECLELYRNQGMPLLKKYAKVDPKFEEWIMHLIRFDPSRRTENSSEAMVSLQVIKLEEGKVQTPDITNADFNGRSTIQTPVQPQLVVDSKSRRGCAVMENPSVGRGNAPTTGQAAKELIPATDPLYAAVANTVSHQLKSVGAKGDNKLPHKIKKESKEKRERMKIVIRNILRSLLLLVIVAMMGLVYGIVHYANKKSVEWSANKLDFRFAIPTTEAGDEPDEHSIQIGKVALVNTVIQQLKPVIIDLNDEKILDWIVVKNTPSSSERVQKFGGSYIHNFRTSNIIEEFDMVENPIRFQTDNQLVFPKACIRSQSAEGLEPGYRVQLKTPDDEAQSFTVMLYIVQKRCDVKIKVTHPQGSWAEEKVIRSSEQGVIEVPVEIRHPAPGDFYVVSVVASSSSESGEYTLALSGVSIEAR